MSSQEREEYEKRMAALKEEMEKREEEVENEKVNVSDVIFQTCFNPYLPTDTDEKIVRPISERSSFGPRMS